MAQTLYCWRCDMELPMLDESEWAQLQPLLLQSLSNIKQHRARYQLPPEATPMQAMCRPALLLYERITGFKETNPAALWHHRLSLYGPACVHCGKPLRTPQAKLCAACGRPRDSLPSEQLKQSACVARDGHDDAST